MRIINARIGDKKLRIKDCKGVASLRGLMFDGMENCDGALIYANSIWMPFVKHELDLVFLDENFTVKEIQRAVPIAFNPKTWKIYRCKGAKYCMEIKAVYANLKALIGKRVKIMCYS